MQDNHTFLFESTHVQYFQYFQPQDVGVRHRSTACTHSQVDAHSKIQCGTETASVA